MRRVCHRPQAASRLAACWPMRRLLSGCARMHRMAKGIVFAPARAQRGEIIEVRATAQHPMETGQRVDSEGRSVPRDIVRRVECRWGGDLVFAADLHAAVAANPYLAFPVVALASGPLTVRWQGDTGFDISETVQVEVR